jgi:hypothetical protein
MSKMKLESFWNSRFQELQEYKRAHGDCNVPNRYGPSPKLGRWVATQRKIKRKNKFSAEREEILNSIGFVWKARCTTNSRVGLSQTNWETRFQQLVEYKKANGNCNVSGTDDQTMKLWRWASKQREAKNKFLLTEEHERKLNSLGFFFNQRTVDNAARWDLRFQQLLEYKQASGNFNVSTREGKNVPLKRWGDKQRHLKKISQLGDKREAKLNSIGFFCNVLVSSKVHWDGQFRELLAYLQTHGDFNVPQYYPLSPLLFRWVSDQREEYDLKRRGKQTSMTPLREAKLDAIGFTWIAGGTEKDAPVECVSSGSVRPQDVRSGTNVKIENTP